VVILSVRVDDTLARAIRELAEADRRPVSNYVQLLLEKHVAEKSAEAGKPHEGAKRQRTPKYPPLEG
jgi:predicted transcriptional regulator